MEQAKIQLSAAEMALVADASVILTKNNILQKTKGLFEELQSKMQDKHQTSLSSNPLFAISPKISRGENYLGLPYIVLDYPRNFGHQDVFAIRSFFWWGHFFSSTLQLSGKFSQQFGPRLAAAYPLFTKDHYFIQVGPDPWAHHFEAENYKPVSYFSPDAFEVQCRERTLIKIAAKWPIEEWPHAANNLFKSWNLLLQVCGI